MFHVLASIKLDNDWNEWVWVGGFSFSLHSGATPEDAARHARGIVDHKREHTVEIQVLNPATKLYDQVFKYKPLTF